MPTRQQNNDFLSHSSLSRVRNLFTTEPDNHTSARLLFHLNSTAAKVEVPDALYVNQMHLRFGSKITPYTK